MSQSSSPKSNKSGSSTRSEISTLSDDSFRHSSNLSAAIDKVLDEEGIFSVRKQVSHDAKKLTPANTPAKNVKLAEGGSQKINDDYAAYKIEVNKIDPLKKAYRAKSDAAYKSTDPKLHEAAITAANDWSAQAVKAGKLRISFLQAHKEELKEHFTIKSTTDHIKQAQLNLKSASEATARVVKHEQAIANLAKKLAAESTPPRGK
ncbi:hypothetical protein Daus18300_000329 [Diaporthe australafricana]|uniref:Uncharacterized protein n=1 Tax=Diaporthe australafricana TaxID=127596 RepID=A0ABR3Y5Q8_9PEZI